jgi:hypothetical protein
VNAAFNLSVRFRRVNSHFADIGNLFESGDSTGVRVVLGPGHTASAAGNTCRVENPSFLPHSRSGFDIVFNVSDVPSSIDEVPVDVHVVGRLDAGLTVASVASFQIGHCCGLPTHGDVTFDRIVRVTARRRESFQRTVFVRLESLAGNAVLTAEVVGINPEFLAEHRLGANTGPDGPLSLSR